MTAPTEQSNGFYKNLIFIKGHVNFAKNDCDDAGEGKKKAP